MTESDAPVPDALVPDALVPDAVLFDAAVLDVMPFDAVVLAGGAGRRLHGADKPALEIAGHSMLDRVLAACRAADRIVVVGPRRALPPAVVQVREQPPGGGPVAALRAGLAYVTGRQVAVLAADLPFLTAATLDELARAAAAGRDGALLTDDDGRDQLLCGVWSTTALRAGLAASTSARMRDLLAGLDTVRLSTSQQPAPWFDCDTEADLAQARGSA